VLRGLVIACLSALLLFASSALAQTPTSAEKAAARDLAREAIGHYEAGRHAQAFEAFRRAHELVGLPTTGLWTARSLNKLGRLVEASELYLDVAETELSPGADPRWLKARDDARAEREELLPRLAKLTVTVSGSGAEGAEVSVDGRPISKALLGVAQPVDPGEWLVAATNGAARAEKTVSLAEGEQLSVALELDAAPEPALATPPEPIRSTTSAPPDDSSPEQVDAEGGSSPVAAYVAFGVGGAAAIVTGVMVGLALAAESDLKEQEETGTPLIQDDIDRYDTFRYAAAGTGAAAGAVLVTGLVLFLVHDDDGGEDSEDSATVTLTPLVGFGSAAISGSF